MTFFNLPLINLPIKSSPTSIQFRGNSQVVYSPEIHAEGYSDQFNSNPKYQGLNSKATLMSAARANPKIKTILEKYNIPLKLNMPELEKLQRGHLHTTRVIAAQIYSALPKEIKSEVNLPDLQAAAMFHDYGKVLIPTSILNKDSELTDKEYEIMQLHSELGYELLKNSNLNENSLKMIKNHHNPRDDIGAQILSTADKYSALREKRCYKEALSQEDALRIIQQDVEHGTILPEVYEALKKSV